MTRPAIVMAAILRGQFSSNCNSLCFFVGLCGCRRQIGQGWPAPAPAARRERSQVVAPQIVLSRPTETLTTPTPLLIQNAWDDSPSPQFQTPSRLAAPSAMNGSPA